MSINVCVFSGNVTKDPEVKQVGEHTVAKFGLAVNRHVKGEKKVSFLDLEVWNKTAEFAQQYVKKGSAITVEAEVRQDTWEDKESGKNRSKLYFTVNNLQLHGKGDKSEKVEVVESKPEDVPF